MAADCAWSLARGGSVGLAAVLGGSVLRAALCGHRGWAARAAWALLLLPYLTPVLLVAYGYRGPAMLLIHHPVLRELGYDVVLWMRLMPVAVLALHFAPAAVSPQALHCHRLLGAGGARAGRGLRAALAMVLHGPLRGWVAGFGVVFLLAFGEFEMASLFDLRPWTVALFDAQPGHLPLVESLRLAALPAACQAVVLLGVLALLFGGARRPSAEAGQARPAGRPWVRRLGMGYLALAALAVAGVPLWVVLSGAAEGLSSALRGFALSSNVGSSVLFGAAGALVAYVGAGFFLHWEGERPLGKRGLLLALGACVPGLTGALVLALLVLAAFQLPGLKALAGSPVPLIVCLGLMLLPLALVLRALLHALRPGESVHAARLLAAAPAARVRARGARILRMLFSRGRFWLVFLLFCWGYFDLTASAILAPPGTNSVFVLLHNQMHYGGGPVLSAMVLIAFLVPVVLLLIGRGGLKAARWGWVLAHG